MVAISLYRGNLHRVPSAPRRWQFPPQTLSLKSFKTLTRKRSLALSRLSSEGKIKKEEEKEKEELARRDANEAEEREGVGENGCHEPGNGIASPDEIKNKPVSTEEHNQEPCEVKDVDSVEPRDLVVGGDGVAEAKTEETHNLSVIADKEERKKELQGKLHILNDKKHLLVQMLKQILNAEEEIKRRSLQPAGVRATTPVAEPALEMGSSVRLISKINVDVNFSGDAGGESDITKNPNVHSRHLMPMHSTSPSAVSPHSRATNVAFQQSPALHPRGNVAITAHGQASPNVTSNAAASPSRFVPTGHPVHAASLQPVSVPGSQFVASSPSPATSGGASSVFRDSQLTSPSWNY
ncbi:hypothetical protein J5N97_009853 [Dioscorea zingiberensis]|uniref:Uncharacterized protein n=1 Tax=Dioscorea zingiberensis TaxID=325984 RepID=A0A9D5CYB6_9LILI|nr:hypothetical protein J5N97_009853 [Dioscorea zingiberensis]